MKWRIVLVALLSLLVFTACGDRGKTLYETARLEEVQNSHDHAKELYHEIISKYPDSKYAPMARERLAALE